MVRHPISGQNGIIAISGKIKKKQTAVYIYRRTVFYLPFLILFIIAFARTPSAQADQAIVLPICFVQGIQPNSPFEGRYLTVRGVVYADLDITEQEGFFIQETNCDNNPATSDGIFIYIGESVDLVQAGDQVQVTGWVNEYYGMTEISAKTENVIVTGQGKPLPTPVELSPPFNSESSARYFESLEGMYVSLEDGLVVGPTDLYDRTWLVRADLGVSRVFINDPLGTGELICADDEGLFEITPEAMVSDRVQGLFGALDYSFDKYCIEPLSPSSLVAESEGSSLGGFSTDLIHTFTVGTFNLENLFDRVNDPDTNDDVPSPNEYGRKLSKLAQAIHGPLGEPALLAVQEAENLAVLTDLISQPEIVGPYELVLEDGPDQRGLDVALMYRQDQVQVIGHQAYQICTHLVDGLGPDGNLDVLNPQNNLTCDTDGDDLSDGNRLFSRPPLVVEVNVCLPDCQQDFQRLILVINHWKSKTEDTSTTQYTLPRRMEEAQYIVSLVQEIHSTSPNVPVILLGDFNDALDSPPLRKISDLGMQDQMEGIPKTEGYSYIYQGISQVLDYVFAFPSLPLLSINANPVHINADYPFALSLDAATPTRSSDHDAILIDYFVYNYQCFLPLILASDRE
jgi:predicted extracellular nuclease